MTKLESSKRQGAENAWLSAAYEVLTESGVEAVKVGVLSKKLGLTRSGFYWYFKDREALLDAMIARWDAKNTGNLIRQTEAYADTITEAMLNLFECWLDADLFDSRLDLAIRNWARNDPDLQRKIEHSDRLRARAIADMYRRFGFSDKQAEVRSMTVLYTQIGYISMQVSEALEERINRMPDYVEVYTDKKPSDREFARFKSKYFPT
ncbi:Tetracycline repressor protein class A from transposon [Aliiroseovarius sp. xm-m-379]|uniref:TetR/AcrR family transcriptional regulator n=1 Tax=unclassified Aliiroseovarius TaxID=2623558 RepID=UPI00156A49B1|nr:MULTISPECIES: TetR/AcrR family transcriptional regulator [unclassified Aliiroseovarius]NRP13239.1 Tetracycline repressor protein class A from transposon [Aliiroseovarius sp. xm-d-517]NRP25894.1 Tetracycline repressor protein class A from transposon [Aliiroseovarius sp. xm-m-379]NRP30261.1 Tetracycline repressor protein class A from transposon [Aliiroseovarius sp. xm-m-314]NRP34693.1 Tetracycline repressor protein class A from transposon [Aliiroseovarius sp. xm-a-104]NRP40286.1 Tetracycline 